MIGTTWDNGLRISATTERMGRHYRAQHGADSLTDAQIGYVLSHTLPTDEMIELYKQARIEIEEEYHE
jgi:hypothetical protein